MIFPSLSARSAPCLSEPSTTRRSTAAADPILAGVTPSIASLRRCHGRPYSEATTCEWLYCDSDSRTSSWRFSDPLRSGASSMARSTTAHPHGETSSSLHPGVNTVRPHPSGSGRSVLTPGPHRLLRNNQAPHLWCVASKRQSEGPPRGRLTRALCNDPDRDVGEVEADHLVERLDRFFDQALTRTDGQPLVTSAPKRRLAPFAEPSGHIP